MVFSVMMVDRDDSGDIRRFGTNGGYRHCRISARRLQEMRRQDIRGAGFRWRNGWLVRVFQIACIRRTDGRTTDVAPEKAPRLRHNQIESSPKPLEAFWTRTIQATHTNIRSKWLLTSGSGFSALRQSPAPRRCGP